MDKSSAFLSHFYDDDLAPVGFASRASRNAACEFWRKSLFYRYCRIAEHWYLGRLWLRPQKIRGYLRLITYCASSVLMVQYSRPLLRRRAVTESQTSFFYQYLVGLAFFVPGLLLGQRVGAWSFKEGERGPLFLLLVVFLCYLFAQAFLEFLGPLI